MKIGLELSKEQREKLEAGIEGYIFGKLQVRMIDSIKRQAHEVNELVKNNSPEIRDATSILQGVCELSLGLARRGYETTGVIEKKYGVDADDSENAFYDFTYSHKQLCLILAEQKPWGEKQ